MAAKKGTGMPKAKKKATGKPQAKSAELLVAMTGKASPAKAAEGDKPVFAYIESLPEPQKSIAKHIDALAAKALPDLKRAVKWGMAYYGVAAAFGGDPTRVALGGQSAGAQDTGANQLSPLATGLFNRAIYESAPLASLGTAATALTRGTNFAIATLT